MERTLQAKTGRDGDDPPSLILLIPAVMWLTPLGRSPTYHMVADRQALPLPCSARQPRGRMAPHRPGSLERIAPDRHALSSTASFSA